VPVSAAAERALCTLRRAGHVHYTSGTAEVAPAVGGDGAAAAATAAAAAAEVAGIEASVLRPLRSTGAALALSCALALRPPLLAFPVGGVFP
jgi:hypothetical protein